MAEARRRVLDEFGVVLEREVQFLGALELPPAGEVVVRR
jgi:UDP-N-acetylenolpyruvoylglucosamine reductase